MKKVLLYVLVIILMLLAFTGGILFNQKNQQKPIVLFSPSPSAQINPSPINTASTEPTASQSPKVIKIIVTTPQPNQVVASPLKISGQVQGNWFFEAQAPVKLVDANGKTVATGQVRALGNWQTSNLVPFSGQLTFTKPLTPTGQLIFQKDNPSGLPQNDQQFVIPLKFQ